MFTEDEKKLMLKSVSGLIKEYRGAGPKSHYIKYFDSEFHIHVKGTLSHFERYLIKTFGQDYIDAVYKFYYLTVDDAIKKLDQIFAGKFELRLLTWEPDLINDQVVYKVRHK